MKSRFHRIVKRCALSVAVLYAAVLFADEASTSPGGTGVPFVREWGGEGTAPGEFNFPIGIAVDADGVLQVTDHYNSRVQSFRCDGTFVAEYSTLSGPGGIALDKIGNAYITHFAASMRESDQTTARVSVYAPDGRFLRAWGKQGAGEGEFDCPGGIAIGPNGDVYIADQTNHRVQVFDPSGTFLRAWGEYGTAEGQFGGGSSKISRTGGPQFVATDSIGNVWTTEGMGRRIQEFTCDGAFVQSWGIDEDRFGAFGGGFAGFGGSPTGLHGPVALCFDPADRLWISAVSGRIQQFTVTGEFVKGVGGAQGDEPGQFLAPHGVAVDSLGRLFVLDSFNHRVQEFDVSG